MDAEKESRIHLAVETLKQQAIWYRDQIETTRQAVMRRPERDATFRFEREFLARAEELENAVAKVEGAMGWRTAAPSPAEEEQGALVKEQRDSWNTTEVRDGFTGGPPQTDGVSPAHPAAQ